MTPAARAAVACTVFSALATAYQFPPTEGGCVNCRHERRAIDDAAEESLVQGAAEEGGLSMEDTTRLLSAIEEAASKQDSFMVTVTDGGMQGLAQNMIRSLDAASCGAPRLIIGLGAHLCKSFWGTNHTTCVEVFRDATSEDEVAWGSHEYWQVVFRKHAVLTVVAMSNVAKHVVYTDPDIVFLDCPVWYFVHNFGDSHDIVFSNNNMLDPNATSIEDLAETYETRGMANILLGPHSRRADINTGLFMMSTSDRVSTLMLKTLRIFKRQEFIHGHYQQFSLVSALDEVPSLRIGVAPGDRLVNGNVFWGHRELLKPAEVISVHANWMQPQLKIPCFKAAELWADTASTQRRKRFAAGPAAVMDSRYATVESCEVQQTTQEEPSRPTSPGCYLWLPSGCKRHKFNAQDKWRLMYDLKSGVQCEISVKNVYNNWCGVTDAKTLHVAPVADHAPREPGEAGCYVWVPSGCQKHEFHATRWWRKASEIDYPTPDACRNDAPGKYNKWCGNKDAQALWVPPAPEVPSEPGCYAWLPTGCKNQAWGSADGWVHDTWGEQNAGARTDQLACLEQRKTLIEKWCSVSNIRMAFVAGN